MTGLRAPPADVGATFVSKVFAVRSALIAKNCAHATHLGVVFGSPDHEIGTGQANPGTISQRGQMLGIPVTAPFFQAMNFGFFAYSITG